MKNLCLRAGRLAAGLSRYPQAVLVMRACSLRISPKRRHRRVEGLHLVIGPAGIDFVAILWRSRPRSRLVGLFVWHFFHSPQSLLRITAQWEGLPGTAVAGLDNDG